MSATLDLGNLLAHLSLDSSQYIKGLNEAAKKIKKTATEIESVGRKMSLYITAPLTAFFTYAIKESMESEKVINDLSSALAAVGVTSQSVIEYFKRYAKEVQKTTIYSDEQILSQLAYAKNLGISTDKLEEATNAAIGLAARYRVDLSTAVSVIGRASQGVLILRGSMAGLRAVINDTLSPQEKYNKIVQIGLQSLHIAEEQTKTTTGSLIQLKNQCGEIAKGIGLFFLPYIKKLNIEIKNGLAKWDKLADSAKILWIEIGLITAAIGPCLIAVGMLLNSFVSIGSIIGSVISGFVNLTMTFGGVLLSLLTLVAVAYSFRAAWNQGLTNVKDNFQWFLDNMKMGWKWLSNSVIGRFITDMCSSWIDALSNMTVNWKSYVASIGAGVMGIYAYIRTYWEGLKGNWSVEETMKRATEMRTKIYDAAYTEIKTKLDDFTKYIKKEFEITSVWLTAFGVDACKNAGALSRALRLQMEDDFDDVIGILKNRIPLIQSLFKQATIPPYLLVPEKPFLPSDATMPLSVDKPISDNLKSMNEMIRALKNEYNMLGLINEERERAVDLAKFQTLAGEEFAKDEAKRVEMVTKYVQALDKLAAGRRNFTAFTVQIKQWTNDASNLFQNLGQVATRALDGISQSLTDMVMEGKMDFASLSKSIISDLMQMMIRFHMARMMMAMFPSMSVGNSISALVMHGGGIVGETSSSRYVSTGLFAGAPRLHGGLKSDEFPAILQKGEEVVPKGGGGKAVVNINVNAIDAQGTYEFLIKNKRTLAFVIGSAMNNNHPSRRGS